MSLDAYLAFIEKFESPEVQEKLKTAYQIGYMAAKKELEEPSVVQEKWHYKVIDLGLPSGTKWIRLENQDSQTAFTRFMALKEGFKLPTVAQCEELAHCKFEFDQYDARYHQHIIGPNGVTHGLYYGWTDDIKFYLWPSDVDIDRSGFVGEAFVHEGQYPGRLEKKKVSLTDRAFSMFVLDDKMMH